MRERRSRYPAAQVSHERWLVSYADFVTLLFAFFVVLFASSYHDHQSIKKVSKAIEGGFEAMGALPDGQDASTVPGFQQDIEAKDSQSLLPIGLEANTPSKSPLPATSQIDMAVLKRQLTQALGSEIERHEVVMRVTPEGFVISLREMGFFNSGEANLLPGAAEKIKRIAAVLMQNGLDIRVEGHSDDMPIHTALFRSNWELSTARAMAVLLLLVDDSGFDPQRISVAGYGQYRPVTANDSAEGRKMNRRVDLVVVGVSRKPEATAPLASKQVALLTHAGA